MHFEKLKYNLFLILILLAIKPAFSQKYYQKSPITFIENKGQWQDNILFRAEIPNGALFLEKDKITYVFSHPDDVTKIHDIHHGLAPEQDEIPVRCHAYNVTFINCDTPKHKGVGKAPDYNNYYVGNDSAKWAANCTKYYAVEYESIYPNIDFRIYTKNKKLKYDFIVHAGANPKDIALLYRGISDIKIINKDLVLTTSINNVIEKKPISFQGKKQIKSAYALEKNKLQFTLGQYDTSKDLIIDPTLVFATYSGSTSDNWGYTATYDASGHLYSGGVAFANGYPTTIGAFQSTYGGGFGNYISDIVVSKYTPDGSNMLYSTYIGGNKSECPHSLIVDGADNLIIFGSTSSANYPTSNNAYNTAFNGGTNVTASGINYASGSDIIVTKLNASGTSLLGSTFIGGSGNDGLNTGSQLAYNYADYFRGEVNLDANDNIVIASCTKSANFPIIGGIQSTYGGTQDAVVFKLNTNLTSLIWSTYLGGNDYDAAYGMQHNNVGDLYIVGGTISSNFPTTSTALHANLQGGTDGFVVKLNAMGNTLLSSSYIGTSLYDQTYFVQLDGNQDVYILGQTEGSYPITPASVYANSNSGQYIHKLTPNLSNSLFSTTIGRGSGSVDIALTAFLVNDCDHIYISGWGGSTNISNGGPQNSTTIGLPLTADAQQSTTDGSDFYLMVLGANASGLIYASYFGGGTSREHVDGGTSRFDKNGIVYQAVCGGCGGHSDFPTTAGAWSNTNNSNNCNLASFKFDLSTFSALADVNSAYQCTGTGILFQNNSVGGSGYTWFFGDGTSSTDYAPIHTYQDTGVFDVMLIVTDPSSCIVTDTSFLSIIIAAPPSLTSTPVSVICPGDTVSLLVSGADSYSWQPTTGLSDPTIPNPVALATSFIEYTVTGSTFCGSSDIIIPVNVFPDPVILSSDTSICRGETIVLSASGGKTYSWTPTNAVNFPDSNTISTSPFYSITYSLEVVGLNNCIWNKTITIEVDTNQPIVTISNDTLICLGDNISLFASGGFYYQWSPGIYLDTNTISAPVSTPFTDTKYLVKVTNGCGSAYDSVEVKVNVLISSIMPDTMACGGDSIPLRVFGGQSYIWTPSDGLDNRNSSHPMALVKNPITYKVIVFDSLNCSNVHTISLDTFPSPVIDAGENFTVIWSKTGQLLPTGEGVSYNWTPSEFMDCNTCFSPNITPIETTIFTVTMTDNNGCIATDSVTAYVTGSIYIPNSFTPDGNNLNDYFKAFGKEIDTFEMIVYNRWGQLLFTSKDINIGWDGTYKGKNAEIGTYVWKIWWKENSGNNGSAIGHVNLIR